MPRRRPAPTSPIPRGSSPARYGLNADVESSFVDQRLVSARVSGRPARFIDKRPGQPSATEGEAERFDYDLDAGVVRFEGNARIADATNEVTGALLVYDVAGQQIAFEGDSTTGERVKIVVQPPKPSEEPTSERERP